MHRNPPDDLLDRARSEEGWERRLTTDVEEVLAGQDRRVRDLTGVVVSRSAAAGAEGVAITGSTARGRRTPISDVDFLVVGPRPRLDDLTMEVDVRALRRDEVMPRLEAGDEYLQWALRFGCIVRDTGVFREAAQVVLRTGAWPDAERKRGHAKTLLNLATRILDSGDRDAADENVRACLTALAHWVLLANRVFPLSRDELSDQILELGSFDLAAALHRSIHSEPGLDELAMMLRLVRHTIELPPTRARTAALPTPA
jgi:hypothetical protein